MEIGVDLHFLVSTLLPCEIHVDQQSIAVMVLFLKLSKWGLRNAEYAWIGKCALQSLSLPGSTDS